jgi:hypothetical protein
MIRFNSSNAQLEFYNGAAVGPTLEQVLLWSHQTNLMVTTIP